MNHRIVEYWKYIPETGETVKTYTVHWDREYKRRRWFLFGDEVTITVPETATKLVATPSGCGSIQRVFDSLDLAELWIANETRTEPERTMKLNSKETVILVTIILMITNLMLLCGLLCSPPESPLPIRTEVMPKMKDDRQRGWTIEPTYGGAWIVRDEHAREVAGGMSEKDARHYAKLEAEKQGMPEQDLRRIRFEWE